MGIVGHSTAAPAEEGSQIKQEGDLLRAVPYNIVQTALRSLYGPMTTPVHTYSHITDGISTWALDLIESLMLSFMV